LRAVCLLQGERDNGVSHRRKIAQHATVGIEELGCTGVCEVLPE
jgi:hypothetical protein